MFHNQRKTHRANDGGQERHTQRTTEGEKDRKRERTTEGEKENILSEKENESEWGRMKE